MKIPKGLAHAGEDTFDQTAVDLYKKYVPPAGLPDLGYIVKGSKSVLDQDLTHDTSGLLYYPAFDDGFAQGVSVYAPEDITVTQQSSANPGDAFYATGKSKLKYWFGHLDRSPANGAKFAKGAFLAKTCANNVGGGPHVHLGVNVEGLWGTGKQLYHSTNYTHNGYTIGEQLADGPP